MKHFTFRSVSATKFAGVTVALLVSALFAGNKVQAQDVNFYVSETSSTDSSVNLLDYSFSTTGTATLVNTYAMTGVTGASVTNGSALQTSGNGALLSYAGFTTSNSKNSEILFTTATGTFSVAANTGTATSRSNYTQDGTAFYLATGGSTAPGFVAAGGTATTSVATTGFSAQTVTYNSATSNLYVTRLSGSNGGVETPTTGGQGLVTTPVAFTELSGTGWVRSDVYDGLGVLGSNTLIVADSSVDQIQIFGSSTPATLNSWNIAQTLTLSAAPLQLSVDQVDSTDALIFFTTTTLSGSASLTGTSTNTFDEVSFNSTTGFGAVDVLGTSTGSEFFSGIAAVESVPEPGTDAMLALGLGLLCLILLRKRARQDNFLK